MNDESRPSARRSFSAGRRKPVLRPSSSVPALLLLLVFLLLSGCRPTGIPSGRLVLDYWEKWTGFEAQAMQRVVDDFNRSQDRLFVRLLTISQVNQKALLAAASGNPPDLVGLWSSDVPMFAARNALLPVDEYAHLGGIRQEDYLPAFWDLITYRDHLWGLPTASASIALHWNKDLFEQAGLDPERPPRTLEELQAYADRLTRRDQDGRLVQIGFLPAEPGWWNWAWGYFFGGSLWDGERPTANSPENVQAYEWVRAQAERHGIQQLQVFQSGFGNFSSPQNAFLAGKVAMELQGVWMNNFVANFAPHLRWGAAPFPYPANRPDLAQTVLVEGDLLAIPRGARHPREAFEFMRFVNRQDVMERFCLGHRIFTPLRQVSRHFLEHHPNPAIETFIHLARSPRAFSAPKVPFLTAYQDEMSAAFDAIWLGEAEPQQALDQVQERVMRLWQREQRGRRKRGK